MPRRRRKTWNLYPRNKTPRLDMRLFRNPPAEYRGAPFWSWNCKLDRKQLLEQIDRLAEMGFGGFHVHARTGLADEYLGETFMSAVRACVDRARRRKMLAWLYDEDRWPSGFAGGLVTHDERFRQKLLLWTTKPRDDELVAKYHVALDAGGRLKEYRRIHRGEANWHAYLVTAEPDSWFNNQTYIDTFDRRAVERFLEITHDRYAAEVGDQFGGTIPAIFTDEPHFHKKPTFQVAGETRDLLVPFSPDLPTTFRQTYGFDLLDHLPEIFWNLPADAPSRARYCWHDHTAERFAAAFGDTIAAWCRQHGIALTGHMLSEATLHGQTRAVGEVMRAMRSFQLPGIDMLEDKLEFTTAKQAQSLAHQFGRPGVLSELYGVTGWNFDFAGHKRQGDWQAALGVTVRVPHLAWVSMAGEAKRDYPAAIDYHSPWFREYPLVENHFARVNTVLTRGRPVVRVGVIHPIESFWLSFGAIEQNAAEMREREQAFADIVEWLLYGLIDFDFISESVLAQFPPPGTPGGGKGEGKCAVGTMRYDAIVLPNLRTIRSTTLKFLRQCSGTIIFAGDVPSLVDAQPSNAALKLRRRAIQTSFSRRALLAALEPYREIDIRQRDGARADKLVHQIRADGRSRHVFIANTDPDTPVPNATTRLRGRWSITQLDTMTGRSNAIGSRVESDETVFTHSFAAHDHLLVTLEPRRGNAETIRISEPSKWIESGRVDDPVAITLSEPNVLLLDQAEWRLDDGRWQPLEEILRIDNLARRQLELPLRGGRMAQPWTDTSPAPVAGRLSLRFDIESDVPVRSPRLALEEAEDTIVHLNGRPVKKRITGWWVDESIKTIALPPLRAGRNEMTLSIPLTRKTNVEWCYLLGDFGVAVSGRRARITAPVRTLAFGDWTHQGLPFYAGNVTYHCKLRGAGRRVMIEAAKFRNPLLSIDLDGKAAGKIAFAPYRLDLGRLSKSDHRLDITAFGNRHNAFGPIHHTNEKLTWIGPAAWRSEGAAWSYEYQLKKIGVLAAPIVMMKN